MKKCKILLPQDYKNCDYSKQIESWRMIDHEMATEFKGRENNRCEDLLQMKIINKKLPR